MIVFREANLDAIWFDLISEAFVLLDHQASVPLDFINDLIIPLIVRKIERYSF